MPYKDPKKQKEYFISWRKLNYEKQRKRGAEYYKQNRKKIKKRCNAYYHRNREEVLEKQKAYNKKNSTSRLAQKKSHYRKNRKAILKQQKAYCRKNRKKRALRLNSKYKNNLNFRLSVGLRNRIRKVLKGLNKSQSTMRLLGCSIEFLREHLEKQFRPGMTWENYGPVWHVDHIRPCASFDLADSAQQRECFHFTNLQPLFALENILKGTTYASTLAA